MKPLDCRVAVGYHKDMKVIVICERPDGWTWRIEHQEDGNEKKTRTCIGTLTDARELANAILAYVDFTQKHG